MTTQPTTAPQSATALGQPRWFFGMLAEVKASAADTAGQYTLVEITAPPGLEAPLHVHYSEDEGFYVLEGSATIVVGDETVELTAGQHAFGPRDVPHRFIVGPDGARMLWVLAPGGFEHLVEAVSVPAEAPTVPPASVRPPENVAEILLRYGNELLGG
jgi:mannose-6-phosphate isomerase-like protein (cupin superfamily)